MLHKILRSLDAIKPFDAASAHCDIPCGVYDPAPAQIAALTVIRLLDLIQAIADKDELTVADHAQLTRLVAQKEQHANHVKEEIRIIWGDYFKAAQFEKYPKTNELVHSIMMEASKCKQNISAAHGESLLALVNEFAEAFWATKGVETFTATSPYAPAKPVVYPKLAQS